MVAGVDPGMVMPVKLLPLPSRILTAMLAVFPLPLKT
jgi:hypothetical protein